LKSRASGGVHDRRSQRLRQIELMSSPPHAAPGVDTYSQEVLNLIIRFEAPERAPHPEASAHA
jgi:hypothetical protein